MENDLPMVVFGIQDEGSIAAVIRGEKIGTYVCNDH
jgi:uridylate kinase